MRTAYSGRLSRLMEIASTQISMPRACRRHLLNACAYKARRRQTQADRGRQTCRQRHQHGLRQARAHSDAIGIGACRLAVSSCQAGRSSLHHVGNQRVPVDGGQTTWTKGLMGQTHRCELCAYVQVCVCVCARACVVSTPDTSRLVAGGTHSMGVISKELERRTSDLVRRQPDRVPSPKV